MRPVTNYLVNSLCEASKFLKRDFFELSNLQASGKKNLEFARKSVALVKDSLKKELGKRYGHIIFTDDGPFVFSEKTDRVLSVEPMDSLLSFSRSLPFFGLSVSYLEISEGQASPKFFVALFPALDLIIHAEKGYGARLQNIATGIDRRVRVAGGGDIGTAICASNDANFENSMTGNSFINHSPLYSLFLFISGKVDFLSLRGLHEASKYGFRLAVQESGGMVGEGETDFFGVTTFLYDRFKHKYEKILK